jgi:hypothetical protein
MLGYPLGQGHIAPRHSGKDPGSHQHGQDPTQVKEPDARPSGDQSYVRLRLRNLPSVPVVGRVTAPRIVWGSKSRRNVARRLLASLVSVSASFRVSRRRSLIPQAFSGSARRARRGRTATPNPQRPQSLTRA